MKIVDAHAYIGDNLYGGGQGAEELLQLMDACGIDQAVIAPHRPPGYVLWPANLAVAEAVRAHPDRFFGMVRVDPWQGRHALDDLQRAHEVFGARGLLLHPWEEHFQISSLNVDPLVNYAAVHGMFIIVEAGYPLVSHPLDIAEIAHRHPDAVLIATHGLQLDSAAFALTDAELAMRECQNLLMETSGMYAPETMENLVRDLGSHRLLFGSHSPWLNLRLEVERARLLNLQPAQQEDVLGGNILRLLDGHR
jgi:predicted TIM-barrel fold metal-dependent hydrolase